MQIFYLSRQIVIFSKHGSTSFKYGDEIDLLIYINHIENSEEDWKCRFCDLQGMVVPEYEISQFECAIELADLEPCLGEQLSELRIDLKAKSLSTNSGF